MQAPGLGVEPYQALLRTALRRIKQFMETTNPEAAYLVAGGAWRAYLFFESHAPLLLSLRQPQLQYQTGSQLNHRCHYVQDFHRRIARRANFGQ